MAKTKKGAVKAAPNIIEIDGKKLRKVDLKNEWNLRQQKLAKPIAKKILNTYRAAGEGKSKIETGFNMIDAVIDIDVETPLLALLYVNEDEKRFAIDTYEERQELLELMTMDMYNSIKPAIQEFMDFLLPKIIEDTQTYFR